MKGKEVVIKKFLPDTIAEVRKWGNTIEEHAHKSVQMHNLARYLTCKYQLVMKEICVDQENCSSYSKCYLGKIRSSGEYVTIEEFCGGNFLNSLIILEK